jgi:alkylhydroperoxidase family enzyme
MGRARDDRRRDEGAQPVYGVADHGAILRLRARNSTIADQIAINYRRADRSSRERAMLDFAVKVATESTPSRMPTSSGWRHTASARRTSGTSAPSPHSSPTPAG